MYVIFDYYAKSFARGAIFLVGGRSFPGFGICRILNRNAGEALIFHVTLLYNLSLFSVSQGPSAFAALIKKKPNAPPSPPPRAHDDDGVTLLLIFILTV
jgi:hypothetical protein